MALIQTIDSQATDGTTNLKVVAPATHAATSKATPVDADEVPVVDSAASNVLKKLTWANLKATLKTYFDTLYPSGSGTSSGTNTGDQTSVSGNAGTATALATGRTIDGVTFNGTANITVIAPGSHAATGKTTPVDADEIPLVDSAASNVLKKLTWANVKATLKTYFDTLYAGGSGTSTGTNTGDQTIALTGDVTGSGTGTFAATLATVNSNVATFGSATKASVVTVNAKGLVTAASESTVTPAVGSVSGLGTGVATFLGTPSSANLAAALTDETGTGGAVFANSPVLVTPNLGTPSAINLANATGGGYALLAANNVFTDSQTINSGTKTTSSPIINSTQTWNGAGVVFDADLITITNTTSSGASTLIKRVFAGSTKFSVNSTGDVTALTSYQLTSGYVGLRDGSTSNGQVALGNAGAITWGSIGSAFSTEDTWITKGGAAATVQIGAANAGVPIAQKLQSQGARAGTDSNTGGGNFSVRSGAGTGTGTLSALILQSPVAAASGTTGQTQTTGLQILNGTAVLTSYTVANLPSASVSGAGATAFVTDASTTLILGLGLAVTGGGANKVPVYSDGTNWLYG